MEENQFCVNLEKIRKTNKLSQKELAEKVNVAAVTISAYEKGNKTPSLDVALRIADYFGVSLDTEVKDLPDDFVLVLLYGINNVMVQFIYESKYGGR